MPVMLNSMKKRDSNYCPETIRGLLSKTSCPSKLMDQQSTAVSFPSPFSCMSVLSNHLTLATQAGSVQLARSPAPMCFHRGYNKQLHLYSEKDFDCLGHRDLKPLLQGKQMPRGLTPATGDSGPIMFVWKRQLLEQRQPASCSPSLSFIHFQQGNFQIHRQGPKGFCKNLSFWNSKTKIMGGSALHMWGVFRPRESAGARWCSLQAEWN